MYHSRLNAFRKCVDAKDKAIHKMLFLLKKFAFNRITTIQFDLRTLLTLQIRAELPDAHLVGHDEELDNIIHIAYLKLVNPDIFTGEGPESLRKNVTGKLKKIYVDFRKEYEINQNKIEETILLVRDKEHIKSTQKDYWLICHYFESQMKDQESATYYLDKAKDIDDKITPLTASMTDKIRNKTRKESKKIRSVIADRGALKISFSPHLINTIVISIAPLFLIAGYLYNKILLDTFDIDISSFFSIEDYITASIEKIEFTMLTAVLSLIVIYLGVRTPYRTPKGHLEREKKRTGFAYYLKIFLLIVTALVFEAYVLGKILFMWPAIALPAIALPDIALSAIAQLAIAQLDITLFAIALLLSILSIKISFYIAQKYFEKPIIARFFIMFVLFLAINLFYSVHTQIFVLKNSDIADIKKYNFEFNSPNSYPEKDMVLIVSSRDFFIFLNKESKTSITSIVVPRNHVSLITSVGNQKQKSEESKNQPTDTNQKF